MSSEEESLIEDTVEYDTAKNVKTEEGDVDRAELTYRSDLTSLFKKSDHSVNKLHFSDIPEECRSEPCQLGVDEAGRGPVLGPMVYGIAYAPLSKKQLLLDLGCADSKSLTEAKRNAIFDRICEQNNKMGWAIDVISPNVISNSMYHRTKTSLNEVSISSAVNLIQKAIENGVNVREIYVDTVGLPEKYQARLKGIFPGIKIVVAKKADSIYPIVSAASICAKVSRDHAIRAWQFRESHNESKFGSGYPTDPVTKKWLTSNIDPVFGFPHIVRYSWATADKILESHALKVEWESTNQSESPQEQKILKFFTKSPHKSFNDHTKRHVFFTERCISNLTSF